MSNTGWVSATERLITCSTSAVAVCCSSASCVSLKRRAFSIAITAWSAKVCSRCTWSGSKLPGARRVTLIIPIVAPSRRSGQMTMLRNPRRRARSRVKGTDCESCSVSVTSTVAPSAIDSKYCQSLEGMPDALSNAASPSGVVEV